VDTRAATLEARIAEVIGEITGREVGPDDPIGLDSLAHAELALVLEEELGEWLPDGSPSNTVRELARSLRSEPAGRAPLLRPGIGSIQPLAKEVMRRLLDRYYRIEVDGADVVPAAGPLILAANHDSFVDIPLLGVVTPRRVWFMGKDELFRSRFGRWFFHALGGFPVRRDRNDLEAIRAGISVLRWGGVLAMYPEGTRAVQLLPFLHGAAWMALVTEAPIVPVRIIGTAESMPPGSVLPRPSEVRVRFGEPFRPGLEREPRARLARARGLTLELRREVERLAG
jgi:1-acyl-sn-glycerol-3-phosphate acyltransferase